MVPFFWREKLSDCIMFGLTRQNSALRIAMSSELCNRRGTWCHSQQRLDNIIFIWYNEQYTSPGGVTDVSDNTENNDKYLLYGSPVPPSITASCLPLTWQLLCRHLTRWIDGSAGPASTYHYLRATLAACSPAMLLTLPSVVTTYYSAPRGTPTGRVVPE